MKSQTLLSLLTVALLTACGGVYDPNAPADPPGPKPELNPPPGANPPGSEFAVERKIARYTGEYNLHYDDGLQAIFENENSKTADNSNTVISAKGSGVVKLRLPEIYASTRRGGLLVYGSLDGKGGVTKQAYLSYKTFQMGDNSYRFSQFGLLNTGITYATFWRGQPVTKLPTEGRATYVGDSVVGFLTASGGLDRVEQGTVTADADFARKRVSVSLASPGYQGSDTARINYDAREHEATFSSNRKNGDGITGKFAGENAEEIVGRYVDTTKKVDAVFGGKRQ